MSVELEEQLARVQNELDDLRAEYNDFAYVISHDMAATFRQIEGFSSIILSNHGDQFDEQTKRHFELVIKGSEKGSRIVEALLGYSTLCTQTLQKTPVDCKLIFDDVMVRLSSKISDSKADCSYSQMPIIEGDNRQLKLLFFHLVHNALHYHKTGSLPIVTIEAVENENSWNFCIKDNGIGIAKKHTNKVFTALKRAVSEKDYDGMGMGLTIAKHIVRNHGGKIWFQEDVANGCAVIFTLPKRMHSC